MVQKVSFLVTEEEVELAMQGLAALLEDGRYSRKRILALNTRLATIKRFYDTQEKKGAKDDI